MDLDRPHAVSRRPSPADPQASLHKSTARAQFPPSPRTGSPRVNLEWLDGDSILNAPVPVPGSPAARHSPTASPPSRHAQSKLNYDLGRIQADPTRRKEEEVAERDAAFRRHLSARAKIREASYRAGAVAATATDASGRSALLAFGAPAAQSTRKSLAAAAATNAKLGRAMTADDKMVFTSPSLGGDSAVQPSGLPQGAKIRPATSSLPYTPATGKAVAEGNARAQAAVNGMFLESVLCGRALISEVGPAHGPPAGTKMIGKCMALPRDTRAPLRGKPLGSALRSKLGMPLKPSVPALNDPGLNLALKGKGDDDAGQGGSPSRAKLASEAAALTALVSKACAVPAATWQDMHRPPMGLGRGEAGAGGFGVVNDAPPVVFTTTVGGGKPVGRPTTAERDQRARPTIASSPQRVIVLVPPVKVTKV